MSDKVDACLQYAHEHKKAFLEELKELIRIPSISTDPGSKNDILNAAHWLAKKLSELHIENVQVIQTEGHPVVFGELLKGNGEKPTVLIYGHYDVQPADPLELWQSGPFEPTERGENLYGRGASDMKGQVLASIFAIESILANQAFPVNIKFILEGEEEIGSPHLEPFLKAHQKMLSATVALNPDTGMIAANVPTIVYGLRGLAYFEIRVYGPDHDLHSGVFGGVVKNPANALCELIAGMHDAHGRITLPGFYDPVLPISNEERMELARLPLDDTYYLQQTGAPALTGEEGYSPVERVGARPTLDVNGLLSGFTGPGSKTVIPSSAMAKISMRLVPNQDPGQVQAQLEDYLMSRSDPSFRWEVIKHASGPACATDRDHPATQALKKALKTVWGKDPVYKREGGSVPIVSDMQNILGIDSVLTGFGLQDDNIHAPNEKLHLPTWYRGIDALIHFFFNL
jgi:acetylornithine deacetylase/succinyl-diaminopimelate desuccinylase-like protein